MEAYDAYDYISRGEEIRTKTFISVTQDFQAWILSIGESICFSVTKVLFHAGEQKRCCCVNGLVGPFPGSQRAEPGSAE